MIVCRKNNMTDEYRKYGRRKAGTWGKPHKENRTQANRATRNNNKNEVEKELNELLKLGELIEDIKSEL